MSGKNFILTVQGEGRGHFTQAIAVFDLLKKRGHTVSCVIVGSSNRREIPEFFASRIDAPLVNILSPNFATDRNNKSIKILKTILVNTVAFRKYLKSLDIIGKLIHFHKPDAIVNFYEPLTGIYAGIHKPSCKIISVAHQNIYSHELFRFPKGNWIARIAIKLFTRMTAIHADLRFAISFYDLPDSENKKLLVCPPILRHEVYRLESTKEDFLLLYLVNSGYIKDILDWHSHNAHVKLHCFSDSSEIKEKYKGEWRVDDTLTFHSLDGEKFLNLMSRCSGMVCTAGFETVCEAMYLNKPVMMIPVEGHYEQFCNAHDAFKAGAGIYNDSFRLNKFLDYIPFHYFNNANYRSWILSMENKVMNAIDSLYSDEPRPVKPAPPRIRMLKKVS
jgi:uncharacterized protein (TIGR00661 family)